MYIPQELFLLVEVTERVSTRFAYCNFLIEKLYSGKPITDIEQHLDLFKNDSLYHPFLKELRRQEEDLRNGMKYILTKNGASVSDEQVKEIVDVIFGRISKIPTRPISNANLIKLCYSTDFHRLIPLWSNLSDPNSLSDFLRSLKYMLSVGKELHKRLLSSWEIHLGPSNMKDMLVQRSIITLKLADLKKLHGHSHLSIQYLKGMAEKAACGIYDSDDTPNDKYTKFVINRSDTTPKEIQLRKEAEGEFDLCLADLMRKKFKTIHSDNLDELLEKGFNRDDGLCKFPLFYRLKLISKIVARQADRGFKVALQKKLNKFKKLEREGKEGEEEYERLLEEIYKSLIKYESISHTDQIDMEGNTREESVSNDSVDYVIKAPDYIVMYKKLKRQVCVDLRLWADKQPKNAWLCRAVVDYIIIALNDLENYHDKIFNVTYIARAINSTKRDGRITDKKDIRRILDKIKVEIPHLKEL